MTLCTCVMAWGTVHTAGSYAELNSALSAAQDGDEIQLTADITYSTGSTVAFSVGKNVTIDGQGHTISGSGKSVFLVQGTNAKHVTAAVFKNLNVTNTTGRVFQLYDYLDRVDVENCEIISQGASAIGSSNPEAITLWSDTDPIELYLTNAQVSAGSSGYPVIMHNQTTLNAANSTFSGYCGLYFKNGSRGSIVNADACNFDCPNVHSGASNAFSCFPLEDDGITLNLHNCGMNIEEIGDQNQAFVTIGNTSTARHENPINITLSGDNSHFNTKGGLNKCIQNLWIQNTMSNKVDLPLINVTIEGGTYSVNPIPTEEEYSAGQAGMLYYGQWKKDGDGNYTGSVTLWGPDIPDTHEVQRINQGGVTLYRVVKKAQEKTPGVMYDLNDLVVGEGVDEGNNPVSSFELSTGEPMQLDVDREVTTAGYVQVKDNESTSDGTVVKVGAVVAENKVDQTLVINNGLDVQGNSKVEVQAGSALIIGEGGITTEDPENIIIEADEDGAASLLLDPTITVNQTPELTVKMTVPAEHAGYEMLGSGQYRHWFRFAMPVEHMAATWAKEPNVPTFLYGWNYSAQEWAQVGVTEMLPFAGYTLSPDQEITGSNSAVTYTFKGQLLGNTNCTLNLNHHGYNFFGNSYTGYISILKLVDQIMGDAKIDGTVWMWNGEKYEGIGLEYLRQYENVPGMIESWQKEVAPMQTFVLRLTGSELSSTDINYADAIWGNPRYDAAKTALNAPARRAEINDDAIIRMTIEANGQKESVVMIENSNYSDAYDRGYDAIKYMNENSFNTYVGINGENYGTVATDNLEGKMLSIKTNNELAYSMTFDFVAGEEYALRDNATNQVIAIEEGATYEFAAQPNSVVEGRFEIVSRANMPTAIENTEVKANVKGIYTILGQYLGEDFDILPAGVYVVNGVKIVK